MKSDSSLFVRLSLFILCLYSAAFGLSGAGTEANPWKIKTTADFLSISSSTAYLDDYFEVDTSVSVLNFDGITLYPIGFDSNNQFTGQFDGKNVEFTNVSFADGSTVNVSLFGYIGASGLVQNMTISGTLNGTIIENSGLIASNNYGTIANCHVTSTATFQTKNITGGLVGTNQSTGKIKNCSADVDIHVSGHTCGGIVAHNLGKVSNCSAYGSLESELQNAGGICGYSGLKTSPSIDNCFTNTSCHAQTNAGGICGGSASGATFSYCIAVGQLSLDTVPSTAPTYGGIVGLCQSGSLTIEYCLWDITTSGVTQAIRNEDNYNISAIGATTSQLQTANFYLYSSLGWEFADIWDIQDGQYPSLIQLGDITIDYDTTINLAYNGTDDITIPVEISNLGFQSSTDDLILRIFVSTNPDDLNDLTTATYYDYDETTISVPAAQETDTVDLILRDQIYYQYSYGTHYLIIIANYDQDIAETDYTNNTGPMLTLNIFDPSSGEPDDTIADLSGSTFATSDNSPFVKNASISSDDDNDDVDWTGISVSTLTDAVITVTNDEGKDITIELYDSTGTNVLATASGDDAATISYRLDHTEENQTYYYVKAYATDGNGTVVTAYDLEITLEVVKPDLTAEFLSDVIYFNLNDPDYDTKIDVAITNDSEVDAAEFHIALIKSDSETFTEPYNVVNTPSFSLNANTTENKNLDITTFPQTIGDEYYQIIADYYNVIAEENENNNMADTILRLHTYIDDEYETADNIEDTTATANVITSGATQTHSIEPAGDIDCMKFTLLESSKVTFVITTEDQLALSLIELNSDGTESTITIGNPTTSGQTYTWSKSLSVAETARTFCIKIEQNSIGAEVPEYTIKYKSVPDAPDLEVKLNTKFADKSASETININITATNIGTKAVADIFVNIYAYSDPNSYYKWKIDSNIINENPLEISSIDPGISATKNISVITPADDDLYYIRAVIYTEDEAGESDTTNNNSLARLLAVNYDYVYGGGAGTKANPWKIKTALQLDTISEISSNLDDYFSLSNDIDLSVLDGDYSSIGTSAAPFTGFFEGNDYTISNYTREGTNLTAGIFGYTDVTDEDLNYQIQNLNLDNVYINITGTTNPVGGLVASSGAWINNCTVNGSIYTSSAAGLLAGEVTSGDGGIITNCSVTGDISSTGDDCGLLIGANSGYVALNRVTDNSTVTCALNCGGFVGSNDGTIAYCYSWGNAYATDDYCGGFAGINSGTISTCYSTGSVTSVTGDYENGFCGDNSGTVSACFWNIATSGQTDSGQGSGYIGLTQTQMKDKDIYESYGWNFGAYYPWLMTDGLTWPRLTNMFNFSGGNGTEESPNIVSTEVDLLLVSELRSRYYMLARDFDLDGWELQTSLFGNLENNQPFTGVFDGNGHTLSNIVISRANSGAGLFGYLASDEDSETQAGIKNLILENVSVETAGYDDVAGCLVGYIYDGYLENCSVRNAYVFGSNYVGGLTGYAEYADISNCCYNGIVDAAITAGGLAGGLRNSTVTDSYSGAEVWAMGYIGGLAGYQRYNTVSNFFWNYDLCPDGNIGTALTDAQMKSSQFWLDSSGMDFTGETASGSADLWLTADNHYPWLSIETPILTADFDGNETVDLFDFAKLAENWMTDSGTYGFETAVDLNDDSAIGVSDIEIFSEFWGSKVIR